MQSKANRSGVLSCAVSALAIALPTFMPGVALAATPAADAPAPQAASPDADAPGIIVTGIRASIERAVSIKRNAASIVDAISAQDIGKLPDATISDSLQRIPGVQIRRDAGEGSTVNVRGLPQVVTLMNGESFLGAGSITSVQPNFTDIPSQLFSGASVIKSSTGSMLSAGISGTIDLKTRRPFDLKSGVHGAFSADGGSGSSTKKFDPHFNGLVSWRNDNVGLLISAAYSKDHLGNSYSGIQRDYGGRLADESLANATGYGGFRFDNPNRGTNVPGGIDVNGNGTATDSFFSPQAHTGWNRMTERERIGVNGSFQAHLSDTLEFVADGFYTKQNQYTGTSGFQMQGVNWQAADFVPGQSRDTGSLINGFHFNTTQKYNYTLQNFDSYSELNRAISDSTNLNAELRYKGEKLRLTLRGVYGKANYRLDNSYAQFSLSDGTQWFNGVGTYPASLGGNRIFNPLGYTYNTLPATVDYIGSSVNFTLPGQLTNELGNKSAYALKTISSEGNQRSNADMKVLRLDGAYEFNSSFNVEFGLRYGDRSAQQTVFDRAAPLYGGNGASNPAGCYVKWKAFDVQMNDPSCYANNASGQYLTAGLTRLATDPTLSGLLTQSSLPVGGVGSIYTINPMAMRDPLAFQNSFYPGNKEFVQPGQTFSVGFKQWSGFAQLNYAGEIGSMAFHANGGLRIINTSLHVIQHLAGSPQPYGLPNTDAGTLTTDRSFTDFLPAFNASLDVTSKLRLRAAVAKNMTPLNLDQWGGGLNLNYAIDTTTNPPVFHVAGGSSNGNPQLDPWRSTNYDVSLEYYLGRTSMISLALFRIDVKSFIQSATVMRSNIPDLDGVVRSTVPITTNVQGNGGKLQGVEVGGKYGFDFLPGWLGGFGIDANYTYSDSSSGNYDLSGAKEPFHDNSKHQINAALWYEKYGLQARVAWNYRSKRAEQSDFAGIAGMTLYQAPTNYVDASVSYDVNKQVTIFAQGSNLTKESEHYFLVWPDLKAFNNLYERRFQIGARARF
ncbi:TonB-dependent receptor [Novosphingobium humi]|uniref:TonB-dependent receptor n=1 Tax=Novosphingobium humi TaxID=2282397 RepID=A0ABY7U4Q9_9SPHN|nr:TonB-dependent receptor [Novosphingobium humi]WCT79902.1 TonB-dependent receptor [Novosphingobium humi]